MLPITVILSIIRDGLKFLHGIVTNLQLRNLMMIATAMILHGRFNLSAASRAWLKENSQQPPSKQAV